MLVTAYLFSIAIGASVKLIYYIKIVDFKLFKLSKNKSSEFKLFEKYAMPSAMLALLAVITTHGMKLLVQKNISLAELGKYFVYLSFAGIFFEYNNVRSTIYNAYFISEISF